MERICPFLAGSDGRTVIDGFDPAHVCRASRPLIQPDRSQQVSLCLDAGHGACERYVSAVRARPVSGDWPVPAPDTAIVQTRLVLPAVPPRNRLVPSVAVAPGARRWALGGTLATVGVVAAVSGVAGGLSAVTGGGGDPSPTQSLGATPATVRPAIGGPTFEPPTPTTAVTPTPSSANVTPPPSSPAPSATPAASQARTYVVQPGDTLNGIAIRFGTSVQALQQANGLNAGDVILVGQVLIIP